MTFYFNYNLLYAVIVRENTYVCMHTLTKIQRGLGGGKLVRKTSENEVLENIFRHIFSKKNINKIAR